MFDPAEDAAKDLPSNAIGDWLRTRRTERGWSQQELATRSGVSQPQISNLEAGKSLNPQQATRRRLEQALGEGIPEGVSAEVELEAEIAGIGSLVDFDPHDEADLPQVPGVYVFYDISDRPIYVGRAGTIRDRVLDHHDKFWFKAPIVNHAAYIQIADATLRDQLEQILIKFLKSNAVLNKQHVDR